MNKIIPTNSKISFYTQEEILTRIEIIELLEPEKYTTERKDVIIKELVKYHIKSKQKAQDNVSKQKPFSFTCDCMGGLEGCSMCSCTLSHVAYDYRYHLYMHYFYPKANVFEKLKEHYDSWNNVVEYSYINSDRMHYNFNLVIQVNDKYYQTVVPDYLDENTALFENLNWVEVTPTVVETTKYIPVIN